MRKVLELRSEYGEPKKALTDPARYLETKLLRSSQALTARVPLAPRWAPSLLALEIPTARWPGITITESGVTSH
jgi:hypothetical protein